ncbi:MAG: cytochrome c maturation protein CcmE [Solirubrobacterales bacterium]
MDPSRKRKIRLIVALSAAVVLAAALVYTSFSASTEAKQPSQLLQADPNGTYELTGEVVPGSIRHEGNQLDFRISDRDGTHAIPVSYSGTVPDPFRDGREVIVTGKLQEGTFVGQRDSLITKCPSKFTTTTTGQSS